MPRRGARCRLRHAGSARAAFLAIELWSWQTDQPNSAVGACFLCAVDDEIDITVINLFLNLGVAYPPRARTRAYAQGGLDLNWFDFRLDATALDIAGTIEDRGQVLGTQFGVGVADHGARRRFGLEARHFDIETDSRDLGIHDRRVGGDLLALSFGWRG